MASSITELYRKPPAGGVSVLLNSDSAEWSALRLHLNELSVNLDEYESAPAVDFCLCLPLDQVSHREAFLSGRWKPLKLRRGLVAVTPPGATWKMRYNNGKFLNQHRTMLLHIPRAIVDSAAEQMRLRTQDITVALTRDEAVSHFASTMAQAVRAGMSNYYAEISAHWLAAHLLLTFKNSYEQPPLFDEEALPDAKLHTYCNTFKRIFRVTST